MLLAPLYAESVRRTCGRDVRTYMEAPMRGVLVSMVFCFALMMVGCGASRQSGVCGTMDFPKAEGDAQALIAQGDAAWEQRGDEAKVREAGKSWQ